MRYELTSDLVAYTLVWPREVLASELRWLLKAPASVSREDAGALLLEEAFISHEPRDEYLALGGPGFSSSRDNIWGGAAATPNRRDMLVRLLAVLKTLPEHSRPRPYYRQRQDPPAGDTQRLERSSLFRQNAWLTMVRALFDQGYLDKIAPRDCVDEGQRDQDEVIEERVAAVLGEENLWPFRPREGHEDDFYSLVEVIGDLVSRPRERSWHPHDRCGWHYSAFASVPGQMLYRAKVNAVLGGSGLELANDGEDAGRLVRTVDDERSDLVEKVLQAPPGRDLDEVAHAVSLFRARGTTREAKRSAVVTLAGILETRRALLKAKLVKKDESALFDIANNFYLRHRDAKQLGDYDEAYLDWIFWWYLATVELSDRLLARETSAPS